MRRRQIKIRVLFRPPALCVAVVNLQGNQRTILDGPAVGVCPQKCRHRQFALARPARRGRRGQKRRRIRREFQLAAGRILSQTCGRGGGGGKQRCIPQTASKTQAPESAHGGRCGRRVCGGCSLRGVYSVETNEIIHLSRGNCKLIPPQPENRPGQSGVRRSFGRSQQKRKKRQRREKQRAPEETFGLHWNSPPPYSRSKSSHSASKNAAHFSSSAISINSSGLCACAMSPGPASADGIPAC